MIHDTIITRRPSDCHLQREEVEWNKHGVKYINQFKFKILKFLWNYNYITNIYQHPRSTWSIAILLPKTKRNNYVDFCPVHYGCRPEPMGTPILKGLVEHLSPMQETCCILPMFRGQGLRIARLYWSSDWLWSTSVTINVTNVQHLHALLLVAFKLKGWHLGPRINAAPAIWWLRFPIGRRQFSVALCCTE